MDLVKFYLSLYGDSYGRRKRCDVAKRSIANNFAFMNTKRTIEKQVARMEDFLDLRNINKFANSSYRI